MPPDAISLKEAAALLPSRTGGRLHTGTLYRWIREGRLEGWKSGGVLFVSRAAVLGLPAPVYTSAPLRTRRERLAEIVAAERELAERGI